MVQAQGLPAAEEHGGARARAQEPCLRELLVWKASFKWVMITS